MRIFSRNKPKPETMLASDMFEDGSVQVFNKKTGDYLTTIRAGQHLPEQTEITELNEPQPVKVEAQLSLF